MNTADMLFGPLFFEKNRDFRIYTGGALFSDFFGDDSTDGFFPEEWVASSVKALNKETHGKREGVSRIEGTELWFDDLLKQYPHELLGERSDFGVLTKISNYKQKRIQLHHHIRKKRGWSATQVVIKFLIMQLLFTVALVGLFFKIR